MRDRSARSSPQSLEIRPEVLRAIRTLEIRTRGLVESLFAGEHASVFHGRGFEFSFVRPYQPGDDVRSIDWRVTARRNVPYVRQFVEERDMLVALVVDVSASSRLAPGQRSTADVSAEVAATLAFASAHRNDRFALVLVSDRVEHVLPPGSGRGHAYRLLGDLLTRSPRGSATDLVTGLEWVRRSLPRRASVFVVSDFIRPAAEGALRRSLNRLSRRHDVVGIRVGGAAHRGLPDAGWVRMADPETGREVVLNTGRRAVRKRFRDRVARTRAETAAIFAEVGAELIDVDTATDPLLALAAFFRRRRE